MYLTIEIKVSFFLKDTISFMNYQKSIFINIKLYTRLFFRHWWPVGSIRHRWPVASSRHMCPVASRRIRSHHKRILTRYSEKEENTKNFMKIIFKQIIPSLGLLLHCWTYLWLLYLIQQKGLVYQSFKLILHDLALWNSFSESWMILEVTKNKIAQN